jgi:hypothetical protein
MELLDAPADTRLVLLRSVLDVTKTLLMQVDRDCPITRPSRVTLNVEGRRRWLTCKTIPSTVNVGLTNESAGDCEFMVGLGMPGPERKKLAGKDRVTVF